MLPPSNFSSLSALLWEWRQSMSSSVPSGHEESHHPVTVQDTPKTKSRNKSIVWQMLKPKVKLPGPFNMKLRKNTINLSGNAPPTPLPQSWFCGQHSRPIFALVIGIDDYQHLPKLHGAVNDANSFSTYVKTHLKVPAENVVDLRNEQATRAEILRAFHALSLSKRSQRHPRKDDSIIIYYSGYGGPQEASHDGVQTIIPADYNDAAGNTISAVTSAEILGHLTETMIFDCGGSLEHPENAYVSSRLVTLAEAATEADPNLPENHVVSGNTFVLSAYSQGEASKEVQGHGFFTNTLLKLLKREGSTNTTRAQILARLPQMTSQTPQAHGGITDSPIFSTGLVPPEQLAYPISMERERYTVHAGSVAGITPGAHFFVYRDKSRLSRKKPKVFIADHVSLFTTTLKPLVDAPLKPLLNSPCAIPYGSGQKHDLVVCTPIKDELTPLYEVALRLLYTSTADSYQFRFTQDQDKADISVDASEDGEFLEITAVDERAVSHGFQRIPATIPLKNEDIERFLLNAAHFYRHLNHAHPNHSIAKGVSVEFLKLLDSDTDYDDNGHPYRYPTGDNLFATGIAEVEVDPEEPDIFGLKITNNTHQDLYANIFYFDNSDLSIVKYHPQALKQSPIKKDGGILTIGYDNPGTTGYSYFVRDTQNVDVGFLKVLFSTEPIELRSIPQTTVFQEVRKQPAPTGGKQKEIESKTLEMPDMVPAPDTDVAKVWGSAMFCIVQRRLQEDDDSSMEL